MKASIGILSLATIFFLFPLTCGVGASSASSDPPVTKATVEAWMEEFSNWGRWGEQDQRGTLNLITPAKRRQAVGLVRHGVSVSLDRDSEKVEAIDAKLQELFNEWCKQAPIAQRLLGQKDVYLEAIKEKNDAESSGDS